MGHMGKHDQVFLSIFHSNSHKKLPGASCRTEIYLNEENSEPETSAKEICFTVWFCTGSSTTKLRFLIKSIEEVKFALRLAGFESLLRNRT